MAKLEKGILVLAVLLWGGGWYQVGKHNADRWWQSQQKEYGIVPKIEFVPNPHLSSVCRVEWKSKRTGKTGHGDWISCSDAQSWFHSNQEIEMTIVEKPLWVVTGEPKDAK